MNNDTQWFKDCLENKKLVEKLKKIKLVITDVDGCLTDGKIYYDEKDNQMKNFSTVDGFGTTKAQKAGLMITFLSGRINQSTIARARTLKIPENRCFIGFCSSKKEKVQEILKDNNVTKEETVLFGDDFLDAECKNLVGIFACPPNTIFYIKNLANLVITQSGEHHPFRLLLDLILYVQEKHFAQDIIKQSLNG